MEAIGQELALFYRPPSQRTVEGCEYREYKPSTPLDGDSPVEINIANNGTSYVALDKSKLKVTVRIVRGDGSPLPADKKDVGANVGAVNCLLHALWSQVQLSLNQQVISTNIGTNYPYLAYIYELMNNGYSACWSHLQSILYHKDSAKRFDDPDAINGMNSGLQFRCNYSAESRVIELEGSLRLPLCMQNRLIPNGVPIHLKLFQSGNPFRLMSPSKNESFKVQIMDLSFKVCTVKPDPRVIVGHAEAFKISPAYYYYNDVDVKAFSVAKGQYDFTVEDLYQSNTPNKITVGLIASEAYSGSYTRNPFNFQHYNVNYVAFNIDGMSAPGRALQPNYKNNCYVSAYLTLFKGMEKEGLFLERGEYPNGYCLYVFNINEEDDDANLISHPKKGHNRFEIKFSNPLPEAVTVILIAEFPSVLQIDGARSVKKGET